MTRGGGGAEGACAWVPLLGTREGVTEATKVASVGCDVSELSRRLGAPPWQPPLPVPQPSAERKAGQGVPRPGRLQAQLLYQKLVRSGFFYFTFYGIEEK